MMFLRAIRQLILCPTVIPLTNKYPSYFCTEPPQCIPTTSSSPPPSQLALIYTEKQVILLCTSFAANSPVFIFAACSCANTFVPPNPPAVNQNPRGQKVLIFFGTVRHEKAKFRPERCIMGELFQL